MVLVSNKQNRFFVLIQKVDIDTALLLPFVTPAKICQGGSNVVKLFMILYKKINNSHA